MGEEATMGMKSIVLALITTILSLFNCLQATACSEVYIGGETRKISARNFDFGTSDGVAIVSPRGTNQQFNFPNYNSKPLYWSSKYGSVTFNVKLSVIKTVPAAKDKYILAAVDGMNEKGLKVGTYFLEISTFPVADNRSTIPITALAQYYLDNFDSVREVLAAAQSEEHRVTSVQTDIAEVRLHLYVHDQSGDSAILEYIGGTLIIHRNPVVKVLTNSPYNDSMKTLRDYEEFGGTKYIPGGTGSLERFVRGAYYSKHLRSPKSVEEAVAYGFDTIQLLSEPPGFEHGCTQWTIVTDIGSKVIYFRTSTNPRISYLDLNKLDFSAGQPVRYLNFTKDGLVGDVSVALTDKGR
jgi:penicillin V acylase-like amidase (Ntn superfamily)